VNDAAVSRFAHRDRLLVGLALLFAAGLFLFRLGSGSLWDQDETRYAQASREILTTGDPITLHLNARPWVGPPPLWLWLEAATGAAFGFTEFTVRIFAAVFGVLGVGVTATLGREWFGPRTGLLAGLILATMLEYMLLSRLAVLDAMQVAFMLLALHAFYRGYRDRRPADYLKFFAWTGLATLTRGSIGLVLPLLALLPFLAYRRALRRWREIPWGWGAAIYLGIAAPWFAPAAFRNGAALFVPALQGDVLPHVFRTIGDRAGSVLYYVPVVVLGAVPWAAFLPGALIYHYTHRWHDGSLLCLLWCGASFLFAVLAGDRLPDAVFPFFPLGAIAVARLWEEFLFEGAGRLRRTLATSFFFQIGVVVFLAVASAAFATVRYPREFAAIRGAFVAPLAVLVVGPAATAVLFRFRRYTAAFFALPATIAVFVGILYAVAAPVVETQKPMKPVAIALREQLRPGDRIVGYRIGALASLVFYTDHPVEWVNDPRALEHHLCAPGRAFLVTTREELASVRLTLPARLRPAAARGPIVVQLKPSDVLCGGEA